MNKNAKKVIKSISKIILYAHEDEIIALAEFYREVIGLEQKTPTNSNWVEFSTGSIDLCLHSMKAAVKRNLKTGELPDNKEFKRTHIILELETKEDLVAEYKRITNSGVLKKADILLHTKQTILPEVRETNNYYYFYLTDIVGNFIQIESLKL